MTTTTTPTWNSAAARALVRLHEEELLGFLDVWSRARAVGLSLPRVEDPNYASLGSLLEHVLRCARFYREGLGQLLGLELAPMEDPPAAEPGTGPPSLEFLGASHAYMERLLEAYQKDFRSASDELFMSNSFEAPWGVRYCADSYFEHAVMHPKRHALQLEGWLAQP